MTSPSADTMTDGTDDVVRELGHLAIMLKMQQTLGNIAVGKGSSPFEVAEKAAAEIERLRAERDEALRIAKNVSKALTGLTPGGSEYHSHSRVLDDYFADAEVCVRVVRERFEDGHKAKLALADAEAERDDLLHGRQNVIPHTREHANALYTIAAACLKTYGVDIEGRLFRAERALIERNSK